MRHSPISSQGYSSSLAGRTAAPNVIVVRSLTKFYAVPGLRLGYAVASAEVARQIRGQILPWSVGVLAQEAAIELLSDEEYARRSIALVDQQRRRLTEELMKLPGLYVYPSVTNFLLVRLDRTDMNGPGVGRSPASRGHRHPHVRRGAAPRRPFLPRGRAHGGGELPAVRGLEHLECGDLSPTFGRICGLPEDTLQNAAD